MFDLDDTLYDFKSGFKLFLSTKDEKYGSIDVSKIKYWTWKDVLPPRMFKPFYREFVKVGFFLALDPYPWVAQLLKDIKKAGHRVVLITARHPKNKVLMQTLLSLKKNDIVYDELIVSKKKGFWCRKKKIDLAIDDGPHHITDLIEADVEVIVSRHNYNASLCDSLELPNAAPSQMDSFLRERLGIRTIGRPTQEVKIEEKQ